MQTPGEHRPPIRRSPTAWRWMLFTIGLLVIVTTWIPPVPSETPDRRTPRPWITLELATILLVGTAVTVLALPATARIRFAVATAMIGATLLALALETPIRRWLGTPWWP